MKNALLSLAGVLILAGAALLGTGAARLDTLFGVVIPYAGIAVFALGFVWRVAQWARSPVPFRITTSCGQQKSLPWIRHSALDNPDTAWGAVWRMALEVLLFRSLFRNTKAEIKPGPQLVYGSQKYLWVAALLFHYSFLIVFLRHYRFFTEPAPWFVGALQTVDGIFKVGLPPIYLTNVMLAAALLYLLWRRLAEPQVRLISLPADYFALWLLLGIAATGMLMRYTPLKADLVGAKELALGLATFKPAAPADLGALFYVHLLLVSALFAYFPFSKLMHMGGVFLSPTRNLPNDNRRRRHVNPWAARLDREHVHTYEEWEHEFKDKLLGAGYELEGK